MTSDAQGEMWADAVTEPIVLVQSGTALGTIFGTLDPKAVMSCDVDGICT